MTCKRYTEEQIIGVLKEAQSGVPTTMLSRKHGVSDATIYKRKSKYSGMEVSDVRRMRRLEDENRRLKHLVADLTLDNQALRAFNSKNW